MCGKCVIQRVCVCRLLRASPNSKTMTSPRPLIPLRARDNMSQAEAALERRAVGVGEDDVASESSAARTTKYSDKYCLRYSIAV